VHMGDLRVNWYPEDVGHFLFLVEFFGRE
jgi:hypothetical protein